MSRKKKRLKAYRQAADSVLHGEQPGRHSGAAVAATPRAGSTAATPAEATGGVYPAATGHNCIGAGTASPHESPVWRTVACAVPGKRRLMQPEAPPCQDYTLARTYPLPLIIACDGAGSAPLSHLGARQAAKWAGRLADTLAAPLCCALSGEGHAPGGAELANYFVLHAGGALQELADELRHPVSAFATTLLLAVVGTHAVFWLKVGDGAIAVERNGNIELLGSPGKGEFVNCTVFVGPGMKSSSYECGLTPASGVTGAAVMTDGAAERLVDHKYSIAAPRLSDFWKGLREGSFTTAGLHSFLADDEIWRLTTGDDKGIALAALEGRSELGLLNPVHQSH